jgi:hypothetical protein
VGSQHVGHRPHTDGVTTSGWSRWMGAEAWVQNHLPLAMHNAPTWKGTRLPEAPCRVRSTAVHACVSHSTQLAGLWPSRHVEMTGAYPLVLPSGCTWLALRGAPSRRPTTRPIATLIHHQRRPTAGSPGAHSARRKCARTLWHEGRRTRSIPECTCACFRWEAGFSPPFEFCLDCASAFGTRDTGSSDIAHRSHWYTSPAAHSSGCKRWLRPFER